MVLNVLIMIIKPVLMVIIAKLILVFDMKLTVQLLFTVNFAIVIISLQTILNALAYMDMIKVGLLSI